MTKKKTQILIKNTHKGVRYVDGAVDRVLDAGRYELPASVGLFGQKRPVVEIVLVDVRERELTLKGQEILTSDKVAIRVSILVQFRVFDAALALSAVANYEERIYSDVQLAARRSLALMTLDSILTNRNQLSEEILTDVQKAARGYGVEILRADVKDLIFPGNLQEVMNKVLAAERMSQVQLVEARTKAETQRIDAEAKAAVDMKQYEARATVEAKQREAAANAQRLSAETEAAVLRVKTAAELEALRERAQAAAAYTTHPALLRLRELETLGDLARSSNARLYVDFDRRLAADGE